MYASLSTSGPVKWNHNQESTLFQHASPFEPAYDGRSTATLSERTRELYLQFLWLPESTMPLGQLVHMIQLLARPDSTSSSPDDDAPAAPRARRHPAHRELERLLPRVVAAASSHAHASGGADLEASIMLFVLERHALLREDQSASGERACDSLDDKTRWLSGIEKRDSSIHWRVTDALFSKGANTDPAAFAQAVPALANAPASPCDPSPCGRRMHKRGGGLLSGNPRAATMTAVATERRPRLGSILEDRLEGLMDRLVLWQMALPDAEASADGTKTVRDWTQAFCDDVVQPAFAQKLPEQYKLLRRKLFRIPQWTSSSEDEGGSDGREQPQTVRAESPPLPESHVKSTRNPGAITLAFSLCLPGTRSRHAPCRAEGRVGAAMDQTRRPPRSKQNATMTTIASSSAQPQAKGPIVLLRPFIGVKDVRRASEGITRGAGGYPPRNGPKVKEFRVAQREHCRQIRSISAFKQWLIYLSWRFFESEGSGGVPGRWSGWLVKIKRGKKGNGNR
ncbi:hypothetical protein EDB83DRAFT_2311435 [Lactarius deliciosus]|nr:hypothetical protein EDB83DRAFT_2311435 [Lactarius deliciosus]